MIVDTTFLIDLEREIAGGQTGPAMEFLAGYAAETMRISVITFGELAEGYEDPASPALDELIAPYGIIDISQFVARRYAVISRSVRSSGDPLGRQRLVDRSHGD